jgi:endonuclease/exonuclease/phosphatase family metal-dependent hydrolase
MIAARTRGLHRSVCSLVPDLDGVTDERLRKKTIPYLCTPATLKVGTYNCNGCGLTTIHKLLESSDSCQSVWCLQEVCKRDLVVLAKHASVVSVEVWSGEVIGHSGTVTLCNAIVSRTLTMTRLTAHQLRSQANDNDTRILLLATCMPRAWGSQSVTVACAHLEAKVTEVRIQQACEVNLLLAATSGAVVLGLDANAIDPSSTHAGALSQLGRMLSEKKEQLDDQTLPYLLSNGFRIAFPDVSPTHWSNSHIDHIIHRTITCTQQRVLRIAGSDHLPVIADFNRVRVRARKT